MTWQSPTDGEELIKGNRKYRYALATISWDIVDDMSIMAIAPTWRMQENGDDIEIQKYIDGTGWITKGSFGGGASPTQPPESSNDPTIFAPMNVTIEHNYPTSVEQDINGCSVVDEDSPTLILEITVDVGSLNYPSTSGATIEEISGGVRITGSAAQIDVELAGLKYTHPTPATENEAPQTATMSLLLNDSDGGTPNDTHDITITPLKSGR